jgi:two-component system chemotaxis sensor kinase CheA
MGLSEDIRRQLIHTFKTEQSEHIQKINQGLLALEKNPVANIRQALLEDIFREAHSLKGAARAVGMTTIESIAHGMEDLLLQAKENRLTFSPELFDLLYQALDSVELLIQRVEAGQSAAPAKVLMLLARLEEMAAGVEKTQPEVDERDEDPKETDEPAWEKEEALAEEANVDDSPARQFSGDPTAILNQDETIRVSVSKLDALMAQFSELLGAKIRAEQRLAEVRLLQNSVAQWQKEIGLLQTYRNGHYKSRNGHKPGARLLVDDQEQLRVLGVQANTLYRELSNDTMRLSLVIDELQEEIKRVRMLPLATITTTFGRMVRDLARERGKQINLIIKGGEIELDKRVLEQIKDPLIHLLRNAVDHGIDLPDARRQAGKPVEGQIVLAASQQGNNVVITVSDDGSGLDLQAIRTAATRRGLLKRKEIKKLSDAETAMLIFSSGLSTKELITDISGRGVGLDVVRRNVEELHGTLEVSFEPGQGTTFTMSLPLTLASSRGLLVQVSGQIFALPLTTVEHMLQVEQNATTSVEGKAAITYQGRSVGLAWLSDLLELPHPAKDKDRLTIVIVAVAEKRLGLVVDELSGEQEIVIKSLGKQLAKVGGIAGATMLGSGQAALVLHVADLIKLAARTPSRTSMTVTPSNQKVEQRKTILVVDDSITTRTLEKNILEAAGYEVKLATNGEEALGLLMSEGLPHLIVSDVNMPRLDGFGLTSRIRQDKRYAEVPVILVTSLDSPADKARGIEVGADAYIVKSNFDQGNLLETIEQLV